jgi:hypothetical protein
MAKLVHLLTDLAELCGFPGTAGIPTKHLENEVFSGQGDVMPLTRRKMWRTHRDPVTTVVVSSTVAALRASLPEF